jgi:signal transduction histidine kinase
MDRGTTRLPLQDGAGQDRAEATPASLADALADCQRRLAEALEQQAATREILRAISQSTTDVQPVFDMIAAAALRLCNAGSANVFTYDGQLVRIRAIVLAHPEAEPELRRLFPRPADRGSAASRAVLERAVVAVHDVLADPDYAFAKGAQLGFRSVLGVPLMREGAPIGAIAIGKQQPGPFPPQQVALMQTFADQAVIAIENVRLFRELQQRTAALTQSVEELRVLGQVGQALSSTLDLEAVLRTIVARATALAGVDGGAIFEYDAEREEFRLHTTDQLPEDLVDALGATPMPKGEGVVGQLALTGRPAVVEDISDERAYRSRVRDLLLQHGYRSLLAVPLLREDRVLGGLVVNRRQPGAFPARSIELLQTFATQSALAIHNARLFREIEDKGRQLEIASRHKSTFLANMSHELRTPLNAIIGFTRIVMRRSKEQLDPKQYENLEKILGSSQHLLSLINAVLDLAKVEAGKVEVHAGEVQLAALLEQCTRTVEPLAKDGVALVRDFDASLPTLWSDEEKVRQIVINLLSNAAKFTAQGSIRVGARRDGERVSIVVADTGIGIPADKLDAVFEEFEQVDASSTRVQGGTGLGLAIARRLARLMDGDLTAASTLGSGSTFTLSLPLRYAGPGT